MKPKFLQRQDNLQLSVYNTVSEPVSYTHLDVYKRQTQKCTSVKPSDDLSEVPCEDVYKRQLICHQ